jgi:predicted amidohydrolase YtcJ
MGSSRREFLIRMGGLALVGCTGRYPRLGRRWSVGRRPNLVLYNANIITVDPERPRARAVAIWRDRFLDVGSDAEILRLATAGTTRVDLAGRTVVPGFIDAHTHPAYAGIRHLTAVDCDLGSIADILGALRQRASSTPPGKWVLGFKYDDTKTREARPITRADLDAAVPTHPALIEHRGGHTAYLNSKGFEKAGVTDETPDPRGGHFDRDPASGKLTGRVAERAKDMVKKAIPSSFTPQQRREGVKLISHLMAKTGITSAHDAFGTPEDLKAYEDARDAGELVTRIYCLIGYRSIDNMIAAGAKSGQGDEWVRIGAMKAVCDGSISERTARLSAPYVGRPADHGILVATEEELYPIVKKAHAAGWQIGIHANGDVAIDIVLRLYERVQREAPRRDPRFRIEHCTVVNDDLIRRIRALGAIPTPFSTYVYFHGEKMREYGEPRLNHMFAVRDFLDAGIRVTQASDYPPGPFEPMMALQSSVTRTDSHGNVWGPAQRVTIEEAIRVGTLHGAYASFEESIKGSIEPGKLADLVVLGRDPLKESPSSLISIPVDQTMVGGRWVYES